MGASTPFNPNAKMGRLWKELRPICFACAAGLPANVVISCNTVPTETAALASQRGQQSLLRLRLILLLRGLAWRGMMGEFNLGKIESHAGDTLRNPMRRGQAAEVRHWL